MDMWLYNHGVLTISVKPFLKSSFLFSYPLSANWLASYWLVSITLHPKGLLSTESVHVQDKIKGEKYCLKMFPSFWIYCVTSSLCGTSQHCVLQLIKPTPLSKVNAYSHTHKGPTHTHTNTHAHSALIIPLLNSLTKSSDIELCWSTYFLLISQAFPDILPQCSSLATVGARDGALCLCHTWPRCHVEIPKGT